MRIESPRSSCRTAASLATAVTFAARAVLSVSSAAIRSVLVKPVAGGDRTQRPVLTWARYAEPERGPPLQPIRWSCRYSLTSHVRIRRNPAQYFCAKSTYSHPLIDLY